MKEFEPLKMKLQYFSDEGNQAGADGQNDNNQTPGDNNNNQNDANKGGDGAKKNVSIDDFNSLNKTVSGLSEMMKKFMGSNNNNNSNDGAGDNNHPKPKPNGDNSNDNGAHDDNNNGSERKSWKQIAEQNQQQIDDLQKRLNARDASDKKDALKSYANSYASSKEIDISGMSENLLGEDEATTKQNIDNFDKALKANQKKSTDKGFNTSSKDFKNSQDFLDKLLAQRFPSMKQTKK